ncbi:hypothetical protein N7326_00020 [Corynebacterium sp. ES2794-CONJ1]|uniref:hypothetical protein n=1 Tax=unclassified Corynebacterium TaxID=2624378 RepID=UPI002168813E|nr:MULTISPECIES: hypothetical protein [unclassified Corynebacterium]MCS4489415.1 hypothetical protein [Corynebacterium sp. ES2775-CONJ]MCS4491226.1 hypothetical protein [Corynebacterium sp. ES2715-CONJ3]MCS4530893.1 hypothetical protein [Corynebacterium sp. ES2730-CONJ]MCU9518258.1 hypothetical protein [Corynebacterium sp. ES2794-CONJ1]
MAIAKMPKPGPESTSIDPNELKRTVVDVLARPTASLDDEYEVLNAAHELLHRALQ